VHTVSNPGQGSSVEAWARARLANPLLAESVRGPLEQLVAALEAERQPRDSVFLTVVIRTQARRWEQLQDALLCLAAQTDGDFEVLLMLHEVDELQTERVSELLRSYPNSFAERIRVIAVSGGGRTRPLVEAVGHARGDYLAFFDDDDLLMGHWVASFRKLAEQAPGQLIRANVAVQMNRSETWSDGTDGQRTVSLATAEYAKTFNFAQNLERNHTPFMGFAFPRSFFFTWGEQFDEELPVCEDWDIVMRAALLLGVASSDQLTAIYRQWESAVTSYTSHDEKEWQSAEARVCQKLDEAPFFAPVGGASAVREVAGDFRKNEARLVELHTSVITSSSWKITEPLRSATQKIRSIRKR